MDLVRRSEFGWPSTSGGFPENPTRGLVIHYDGSPGPLNLKSDHDKCVAHWKRTRTIHLGRGWADVGYSFAACPHGKIFEGRGLGRYQAAQGTTHGNSNYYSVTTMLGVGERPTTAQINAIRQLRSWLMGKGVSGTVKGHRDFKSTECPGDIVYRMVQDGTFAKPAGSATLGEDMIGLKRGDEGEQVKALQAILRYAGYDIEVDGDYGPATSAVVLTMRRDQGSSVTSGETFTGWAYAQLHRALAQSQAKPGVPGPQGPAGALPDNIKVSGILSVRAD